MQRTPRKTAGNKNKEILEALKGDHGRKKNKKRYLLITQCFNDIWIIFRFLGDYSSH
jgi:uncharacterized protein Veg